MALLLLVVVGAFTVVTAVVLVAGLVRRLGRLSASMNRLERDVLPALEELQRLAEETQDRAARVSERATAIAPRDG